MRTKMPVVSGQVTSAAKSPASLLRISLTVTSFPFGTCRRSSSTSFRVGINIVPFPKRVIDAGIFTNLGSWGFSSFSRQGIRLLNLFFTLQLLLENHGRTNHLTLQPSQPGSPARRTD